MQMYCIWNRLSTTAHVRFIFVKPMRGNDERRLNHDVRVEMVRGSVPSTSRGRPVKPIWSNATAFIWPRVGWVTLRRWRRNITCPFRLKRMWCRGWCCCGAKAGAAGTRKPSHRIARNERTIGSSDENRGSPRWFLLCADTPGWDPDRTSIEFVAQLVLILCRRKPKPSASGCGLSQYSRLNACRLERRAGEGDYQELPRIARILEISMCGVALQG